MRLQPHPHFDIRIDMKAPGFKNDVETGNLDPIATQIGCVDGYEKLLYDACDDDQSNFVHSEEVLESWRIVDDLLCTGNIVLFALFHISTPVALGVHNTKQIL